MAAPAPLRPDFNAESLRALAKSSRDPAQTRRLLALSAIYAGGSRSAAAALGGVGLQTVRDWVVAFNPHGPEGLIDGKAPGARPRLDAERRRRCGSWSSRARCRPRTGWSAGGWSIWPRSCSKTTACRCPSRP